MRRRKLLRFALPLIAMLAACAPQAVPFESQWAMIKAPSTNFFPYGSWETPKEQWLLVGVYPTEEECRRAALKDHQTDGPRPLDCIPTTSRAYSAITKSSSQ